MKVKFCNNWNEQLCGNDNNKSIFNSINLNLRLLQTEHDSRRLIQHKRWRCKFCFPSRRFHGEMSEFFDWYFSDYLPKSGQDSGVSRLEFRRKIRHWAGEKLINIEPLKMRISGFFSRKWSLVKKLSQNIKNYLKCAESSLYRSLYTLNIVAFFCVTCWWKLVNRKEKESKRKSASDWAIRERSKAGKCATQWNELTLTAWKSPSIAFTKLHTDDAVKISSANVDDQQLCYIFLLSCK